MEEIKQMFIDYLEKDREYRKQISQINDAHILEVPDIPRFKLNLYKLYTERSKLYNEFNKQPNKFKQELFEAVSELAGAEPKGIEITDFDFIEPKKIGSLTPKYFNRLIVVEGLVSTLSERFSYVKVATWKCVHCGTKVQTSESNREMPKKPLRCPNEACGRKDFVFLEDESIKEPYQKLWIEENPEDVNAKRLPNLLEVRMYDDMAEPDIASRFTMGEKTRIIGILRNFKIPRTKNMYRTYIEILGVSTENTEEIIIDDGTEKRILEASKNNPKQMFLNYFSKTISGMENEKESVLLSLFGGSKKTTATGTYKRDIIHVALCGDVSTAKTVLLEQAEKIAPKSIYVSGGMASHGGLLGITFKDEETGKAMYRGGALLRANNGICFINEFDRIPTEEQEALSEVMEEGRIGLAKFGISAQLNTKPTIIAVANPKAGYFDPNIAFYSQLPISPKLISRFDLIFVIRDVVDEKRDSEIVDKMHESITDKKMKKEDIEFLKKYIYYAREKCKPKLTEKAKSKIKKSFLEFRKLDMGSSPAVRFRNYDTLIRISEAHAKIYLRDKVEDEDIEEAISIYKKMLESLGLFSEGGGLDFVNTGVSQKSHNQYSTVMEILKQMNDEYDLVNYDDLVDECVKNGIEEFKAREIISRLKKNGVVLEPKPNMLRLV